MKISQHAPTALVTLLLISSHHVHAQSNEGAGLYATGTVGIGFLGSESLAYRDDVIRSSADADFDPSFTGGGALGYDFGNNWRVEGEILYRRNDMEALTLDGVGASAEGDFASLGIGLTALYQFASTRNENLSFYAGAGPVWIQEIDIDFEVDGSEVSFETDDVAVQIQGGARYAINDRAFVDVGLRYLTASGIELEFPADTRRIVESDYAPVTATLSFGWRF